MALFKLPIYTKHFLSCSFVFVVISSFALFVNGKLIVIPEDTEAATGDNVTFFCKSSVASIEWHHFPVGHNVHELVYQDGFIFNGYKERFNVGKTDNNEYNLVIKDVRATDAGRFTCMENSEETAQETAQLIVFEQYPSNKYCVAKSTSPLELTCNMKSHGNTDPFLEWREFEKTVMASTTTIMNGITISSIHIESGQARNLSCHVKYPMDSSLTSRFSWSYSVTVFKAVPQEQPSEVESNSIVSIPIAAIVVMAVVSVVTCSLFIGILVNFLKYRRKIEKRKLVSNKQPETVKNTNVEDIEKGDPLERNVLLNRKDVDNGNNDECLPGICPEMNNAIHGLGVLDNEMFIVKNNNGIIEVFDMQSIEYKRSWGVEDLIKPHYIAVCPIKKLIFICDWEKTKSDTEIFCVDKDGKLKFRWICEGRKGRISITAESNVVAAESWDNVIREYTFSGQLIKKLETGRHKLHLWHAIKLLNGNFVAGFGDLYDENQEICVINSKKETIRSITKDSLLPHGISLSVPRTLVADKEEDIYVCDLYNGRIILLTSELEYKGKFDVNGNEEKLRGHLRVCLYESDTRRRLLVADNKKENGKWVDGKLFSLNMSSLKGETQYNVKPICFRSED